MFDGAGPRRQDGYGPSLRRRDVASGVPQLLSMRPVMGHRCRTLQGPGRWRYRDEITHAKEV